MAPTKTPRVIVRERISADGKTIRQKLLVRPAKNPTTSPSTTNPPAPPPPPPVPPPAAPTPTTAADPTPTPTPPFTPDQDAQLLDLKSKNTSWKQISIMMDGKPQWQLKDRFKELTAKPTAAADEGAKVEDKEKTAEEKKKEEDEAKRKAAVEEKKKTGEERKRAWEEKKKMEEAEKEVGKASGGGGGGGEPAKAAGAEAKEERKIVFVDGGRFSIEEIVLVHKLAERYENRKWLEVASKFFDTTGKRVHPDEMRDALGGGGQ